MTPKSIITFVAWNCSYAPGCGGRRAIRPAPLKSCGIASIWNCSLNLSPTGPECCNVASIRAEKAPHYGMAVKHRRDAPSPATWRKRTADGSAKSAYPSRPSSPISLPGRLPSGDIWQALRPRRTAMTRPIGAKRVTILRVCSPIRSSLTPPMATSACDRIPPLSKWDLCPGPSSRLGRGETFHLHKGTEN